MAKNLLIVESPAKAKTIEKILGKDFKVKSSYGHVRDLQKGDKGVDIDNEFEPNYEVTPEKKKVVKELKDAVKKVDEVWLATDEDREGEAISWHLCKVLDLDEEKTKRIVFREITAPAIQKAIQTPRKVDQNLVNAQQARRILDRLVGFELSGLLWKKVKGKLSAGRVQSVAVKLIVEREREIMNFTPTPFYRVSAEFIVFNDQGRSVVLKADSSKRYDTEQSARDFLDKCNGADFSIKNIEVKPLRRKPAAPFTTSTLQQEASRKLGFSVSRTMQNAQRLYEAGHITYMRTDSTNLSETALASISKEIEQAFGDEYVQTRRFKSKKDAQEAHEAIRPTYIEKQVVSNDRDQQRLYELIWKRTIASQMAEAQMEKTIAKIAVSTVPDANLQAEGQVLKFDGFLKVYLESSDEEEEEAKGILPPLQVGQKLDFQSMQATERFTRPPSRFTEAGLVKKLEEQGIGRPSTYAPTITKIMEPSRGYIVKEKREGVERKYTVLTLTGGKIESKHQTEMTGAINNRLVPTDLGMLVVDFLDQHFSNVMNYNFTASIEKKFDDIAEGDKNWKLMLKSFYEPFHATVEETEEHADRATGERILGKDPETGRTLLVRMSRLGRPVVQIGAPDELEEDEKPRYGNLMPGQSMETITYEEALELFKLPRELDAYEGKPVSINSGRYGPYVRWGEAYISLPRGSDPYTFKRDAAIELIEEKKKADAPIMTFQELPVTQGKGRFGPFLKWKGMFINIPRRYDPENLSKDDMVELIQAKIEKEANRYVQQWPEENLAIENGRWGPFIRFKKKSIKIPKVNGERITQEQAKEMSIEEVKELVTAEIPDAFKKKTKAKPKSKSKAKPKPKK